MRRTFLSAIALAGVVLLILLDAGCGGRPAAVHLTGRDKTNLTVGAVPVADEAGLYVAQNEGLFKAAGLNVTIDSLVSSADATQGQNDGKYDITAGNSVSYIQAQVNHLANLEIVAEGSLMQPDNQALYTLAGSPISTIAGLRNKRIGVNALNNIGTLLISSVLQEHGMSPREVRFVPMNFPAMGQALKRHVIDAAWLPEPFGSADQELMGLQQLTDLDQGATANFPVSWYVVTKAWARKNPQTLTAFLAALRQGQNIADTNRHAVELAMQKLPFPYTVPPAIAAIMSLETYPLTIAPDVDLARVQRVSDAMYQTQMLTHPFQVSSMLN